MSHKLSMLAEFSQPPTVQSKDDCKSVREEIADYLEKARNCPWNADILMWWKFNEAAFPRLRKLAKMTLGCPATSAAAESAFTIASCVITAKRSSIAPFKAAQILFIHDNYPSVEKYFV